MHLCACGDLSLTLGIFVDCVLPYLNFFFESVLSLRYSGSHRDGSCLISIYQAPQGAAGWVGGNVGMCLRYNVYKAYLKGSQQIQEGCPKSEKDRRVARGCWS